MVGAGFCEKFQQYIKNFQYDRGPGKYPGPFSSIIRHLDEIDVLLDVVTSNRLYNTLEAVLEEFEVCILEKEKILYISGVIKEFKVTPVCITILEEILHLCREVEKTKNSRETYRDLL